MDSRLLISFVIDNSAAVQGERFVKIKNALDLYWKRLKESQIKNIELEIIVFDEFSPKVLKSYKDEDFDIESLELFKMPFLGKSIDLALTDLISRYEYYQSNGIDVYKPWLFILSDAYSFDDVNDSVENLKNYIAQSKLLYMPFILSQKKIPDNLVVLAKAKRFMRIKDNAYDDFFNWFYNMSTKRASTPNGVPVKFDRSDFEGWAII